MKKAFRKVKFGQDALDLIEIAVGIIEGYEAQGYKLSLRQLYYQLVSKNVVPNTEQSYKRIGNIISDAREAGLVDWDMIEDRNRNTITPSHWDSPAQIVDVCARTYRIDKWATQPAFCEVMVEKQALEGVLEPVCNELDIPFTSNKGYSSATMMYNTGQKLMLEFRMRAQRAGLWRDEWDEVTRPNLACAKSLAENKLIVRGASADSYKLSEKAKREGWPMVVVFYMGDHDPSGIDMTRDVADRLCLFSDYTPMEVRRLALNMPQIEELNPPENPAKTTDSRAASYIAQFGESSWELDAVEPGALAQLVRDAVETVRDEDLWVEAQEREARERATLKEISDKLGKPESKPKRKK